MNTRYQPIEITAVNPQVAQLQARASSYLNQVDPTDWLGSTQSLAPQNSQISNDLRNWDQPGGSSPLQATLSDRELLAKTLAAEAGGEGYEGLLAAGAVIANRANAGGRYGDGLRGVIMKPGQFSAWNSVTGYAGGQGGLDMDRIRPSADAYRAADAIISGNYRSPVGNRTHYYNPNVANPRWGQQAGGDWLTIGNHVFGWA